MASGPETFSVSFMLEAVQTQLRREACGFLRRFLFKNYLRKERNAPEYVGPIFNLADINLNFAWRLDSHRKPRGPRGQEGAASPTAAQVSWVREATWLGAAGQARPLVPRAVSRPGPSGEMLPCFYPIRGSS